MQTHRIAEEHPERYLTEQPASRLSYDDAREATNQLRGHIEALWKMVLYLYEHEAHLALGYPSWGEFCKKELDFSASYGYQLIEAGRVARQIQSTAVDSPAPTRFRQARALGKAPPETRTEAWHKAQEQHGEQPTAKQIAEVIAPPQMPHEGTVECPQCHGTGRIVGVARTSVGTGVLPLSLRRENLSPLAKPGNTKRRRW